MAVDIAIQTDAIKCRGNFIWFVRFFLELDGCVVIHYTCVTASPYSILHSMINNNSIIIINNQILSNNQYNQLLTIFRSHDFCQYFCRLWHFRRLLAIDHWDIAVIQQITFNRIFEFEGISKSETEKPIICCVAVSRLEYWNNNDSICACLQIIHWLKCNWQHSKHNFIIALATIQIIWNQKSYILYAVGLFKCPTNKCFVLCSCKI